MPMKTEIVPLLIITKLEQYDYAGATAIAMVMLIVSFVLLLTINLLQWAARRRVAAEPWPPPRSRVQRHWPLERSPG
jgi:sulfate transport system permease protein